MNGGDKVRIEWKSFQLNPDMPVNSGKSVNQYLSEVKGWSLDEARQMNARVTEMAKQDELEYHLDKAVMANSFDAHRLVQLAKTKGLGDAAEEELFKSYFTKGHNIADHHVLQQIGNTIGIDASEVEAMLQSDKFSAEVQKDLDEAVSIGVRGVPFFVIDRKYAVSGAQPAETFVDAINKALANGSEF
jgi:predicted DsbA family dithiol-disulfide isomerase